MILSTNCIIHYIEGHFLFLLIPQQQLNDLQDKVLYIK
jgi:hypothetical protein